MAARRSREARSRNGTRSEPTDEPRRDPALRALLRHIADNLEGDLSLATLAGRAGLSPSRFSHWFRERMGITPHAYVICARLDHAKALLEQDERSLLDVALAVGFTSQSCLNVSFRRRVGMTPSEYRAKFSRKAKDGPGPAAR